MLASATIVKALDELVVCSLNELLLEYGQKANDLRGLGMVLEALQECEVQIDPEFNVEGDLDLPRTLKKRRTESNIRTKIREMITAGGENYNVELKSSIFIDTKRKHFQPRMEISVYVNKALEQKLAQGLCAFLNRSGGVIYLGIAFEVAKGIERGVLTLD